MTRSAVRRFGDLTRDDFARSPVWVQCHTDPGWWGGSHEEDCRPWGGPLPVAPGFAVFLVRATFSLPDSAVLEGFITPYSEKRPPTFHVVREMQPHVFLPSGRLVGFWQGVGEAPQWKQALYAEMDRENCFPIKFAALPGLTRGGQAGEIHGFCRMLDGGILVES